MRLLRFLHPARHRSFTGNSLYPNFITRDPVTPVGPATITDALLLLVFCDNCSSSLSLSFESLDSILISNFHYYFQDGRPTRYYNHRYYKTCNIYGNSFYPNFITRDPATPFGPATIIQIFITTFKMEDQRGIITIDIISLIISMIITEEHGKT